MSLREIVLLANGDDENREYLGIVIERFGKLIVSLARDVRKECAETDLMIFLIKLIKKMPREQIESMSEAKLVNYIVNSLRYKSYKIYREKTISTCELKNVYPLRDRKYDDSEFIIWLTDFVDEGIITKKQRDILLKKYCNDYTDEKIATILHISRQAVAKTHNAALNNLRQYLN